MISYSKKRVAIVLIKELKISLVMASLNTGGMDVGGIIYNIKFKKRAEERYKEAQTRK